MSDRTTILGSIRAALGRTAGAPVPPPPPNIVTSPAPADLVERFCDRLAAIGGKLDASQDASSAVLQRLRAAGARSVILSDAPEIEAMAAPLRAAGITCLGSDAPREQLLAADAGVTSAQLGIAESGTLMLDAGAERSRLASLLPPLHICVLPSTRLIPTLGDALASLPSPLPHAITFISGPSRTADIELQLVVGVHGPKELCVVLVR
jgi:L-lactate dehydrogenase complex protein LldG